MKGIKLWCTLALILILLPAAEGFSCTSVMAAKNGMVLAGHNEDWTYSRHWVNFLPAGAGRFGCFFTSWESDWTIGGVNDQGLFLGDNSVPKTGWRADPAKLNFPGNPRLHILQTCATVADVRKFFETYNVPLLNELHFPFADRTGASMVVEYAQGKVRFVTEKTWYQISTNFLRTDYPGIEVPCNRFRTARQIFDPAQELSMPLIRSILAATHQDAAVPTIYSNIFDLKAGTIYLYHFHNYEEVVTFDLAEELKKGPHSVKLSSLFSAQPLAVKQLQDKPRHPVVIDSAKLKRLTGRYTAGGQVRIITFDGEKLFIHREGGAIYMPIPLSETEFGFDDDDSRLRFELAGDKVIGIHRCPANGPEEPLQPRVEPIEDKNPEVTALVQQYIREAIEGTVKPDLFTPNGAAKFFPDQVKEAGAFFKSLGPQTGIELYEREQQGAWYRYLYRLSYRDKLVALRLSLMEGKRISDVDFHLE